MVKTKAKKKKARQNRGNHQDLVPRPRPVQPPFEVNIVDDLKGRTMFELIALMNASPQWTEAVVDLCLPLDIISLFGNKDSLSDDPHVINMVVDSSVITSEQKMIDMARAAIRLLPNADILQVGYHPRLYEFFPILLNQLSNSGNCKIRLVSIIKSCRVETKWWVAISNFSSFRHLIWKQAELLPTVFSNQTSRLAHLRDVRITDYPGDLVQLFRQFGPGLREFLIVAINVPLQCSATQLHELLATRQIGTKLHSLKLACPHANMNKISEHSTMVRIISRYFNTLHHLHIPALNNVRMETLFEELAAMPVLLEISISGNPATLSHLQARNLRPLSVLLLDLLDHIPVGYKFEQFSSTFGQLFPGLRFLQLATYDEKFCRDLKTEIHSVFPRLRTYSFMYTDRESGNSEIITNDESCTRESAVEDINEEYARKMKMIKDSAAAVESASTEGKE